MITIRRVGVEQKELVFDLVLKLLMELEGGTEFEGIDRERVLGELSKYDERFNAFLAETPEGRIVGISTLVETIAIYAGGSYGIIDEMYVDPEFRSRGVGRLLIEAIKEFGQQKNWLRIDVTAPPEEEWNRTVRFYEREGFVFTGPKMRFKLRH